MTTEVSSAEKVLYCPECGKESVSQNKCTECTWEGCDEEDHDFCYVGDPSVGLNPGLECRDCGIEIDYDGRFDQEDW